ncbi:MAG: glycosyltransferase [Proteobacteria bacterium]|nr:glycosyltransferase [Pseudomonadota bacterium]
MNDTAPVLSVVIPVYNEEDVLPTLFERLYPALDALQRPYEVLFVNDGSRDGSVALLREQYQRRPAETRVILLQVNFGQHAAILAGFARARGQYIVTLDADLQNPPEEVAKLLAELEDGHDYVGTWRANRQDLWWRRIASQFVNLIRERMTPIKMADHGCMLRGYARSVIDAINSTRENVTFIPALASLYAANPTEIEVKHDERAAGASKYSLYRLIRLTFDLMTGFSTVPLQAFSLAGLALSMLSGALVLYLLGRRIVLGPEVDGVFTLFAIVFFFLGIALFGIGLLGEYIGRIYVQVRQRPRYIIGAVLEQVPHVPAAGVDALERRAP